MPRRQVTTTPMYWVYGALGVCVAATVIGMIVLWPTGQRRANIGPAPDFVNARVAAVDSAGCAGGGSCLQITVQLTSGPDRGQATVLPPRSQGGGSARVGVGDAIILNRVTGPGGRTTYDFADFQRQRPLTLAAVIFALVVVAVARWRGFAALGGLVITGLVLAKFTVPAILDGRSPVAVAVVGSALIAFVVLYLAHGVNRNTTIALLATLASLALTGVLAASFVATAHLGGQSTDEAAYLHTIAGDISLDGILLAGIVIGSLGVLNDVTVTQVAAVREIRNADPGVHPIALYRAGMRVGRDHIASTVYTLVLAYAGASLPLLLFITLTGQGVGATLNTEVVATEAIRTLVGSIGLVASVPLATIVAALAAAPPPPPDESVLDVPH